MSILLEIVTPEKTVYSEEVDSVVVPTIEGEIGVLPGHIPVLTMVEPGELAVSKGGTLELLAVDRGFAEVLGDKVSVLTEGAINIDEIDLSAVDEAQARAEKALAEARAANVDPAEVEQLETVVRFSVAQKLIKDRRKG